MEVEDRPSRVVFSYQVAMAEKYRKQTGKGKLKLALLSQ